MSTSNPDFVQLDPAQASALANYLSTRPLGETIEHFTILTRALRVNQEAVSAALVRNAEARGQLRGEKQGIATGRARAEDRMREQLNSAAIEDEDTEEPKGDPPGDETHVN